MAKTRKQAKSLGYKTYAGGRHCKHGHTAGRRVSNGSCIECEKLKGQTAKSKSNAKLWYEANKDKTQARSKAWGIANKDKKIAYGKKWAKSNVEKKNANNSEWKKNNRGLVNADRSNRRSAELNATPNYLTERDKFFITEIYELSTLRSNTTGVAHEVDHIIPLRGEGVCGLHVPCNLAIIPATENRIKGNKHHG